MSIDAYRRALTQGHTHDRIHRRIHEFRGQQGRAESPKQKHYSRYGSGGSESSSAEIKTRGRSNTVADAGASLARFRDPNRPRVRGRGMSAAEKGVGATVTLVED